MPKDEKKDEQVEAANSGVLVAKFVEEDGSLRTGVQLVGDTQITEVLTLLELAQRDFRKALGLGQ